MTYGAGTYVARGSVGFDDTYPSTQRQVLWTSADGITWQELPVEVFGLGPDDEYGFGGIFGGGPELLVTVETGDAAETWRSYDGRTFEPWPIGLEAGVMDESSPERLDHVATLWDGIRWVVVGVDRTSGTVYVTHDLGVPWQPVGAFPEPLLESNGLRIAVTPSAMVIETELNVLSRPPYAAFWLATWDQ